MGNAKTAKSPTGITLDQVAVGEVVDVVNQDRRHARENATYKFVWVNYQGQLVPLHLTDHALKAAAQRSLKECNLVDIPVRKRPGLVQRVKRVLGL